MSRSAGLHGGDSMNRELIDFSANINPLGVPEEMMRALAKCLESDLTRYPDARSRELRAALGGYHGVPPECVLPCNGASEALFLCARLPGVGDRALLPVPSFAEYASALTAAGKNVRRVPLDCADCAADMVILGHPNNPMSRLLHEPEAHISRLTQSGTAVVVDEAFVDMTVEGERGSVIPLIERFPRLIVTRSLTKSLAIPGLRLGYIIARPDAVAALEALQPDWPVNALAARAGLMIGEVGEYRRRTRDWLECELPWMHARLSEIASLDHIEPQTNFVLCRHSELTGAEIQEQLKKTGLWIRTARGFEGLDDHHFRVAVRLRKDNERLIAALRALERE